MEYVIPVTWMMSGEYTIEANSLEEAIDKAGQLPLPESDYMDHSFEVDFHVLREINESLTKEDKKYIRAQGD